MVPKKKTLRATEQDLERIQELRERFRAWLAKQDPARLVFIDEAGLTISMTPTYARAPVGTRALDDVPRNRGTVTTMIGALTMSGLGALMTIEGGTSGEVFVAYVEHVLCPELKAGDIVVMDNLGAHKDVRAWELIRARGAFVKFLPPYSPEFNPIELAWSKVKQFIRIAAARTIHGLNNALSMAKDLVSAEDAQGWFRHCGYRHQVT